MILFLFALSLFILTVYLYIFSLGMRISRLEIVFFQPLIMSFYFFWLPLCLLTKAAGSLNLAPWWWCTFLFLSGFYIFSIFNQDLSRCGHFIFQLLARTELLESEDRDSFIDLEKLSDPYLSLSVSPSRILIIRKSELLTKPPPHLKLEYYLIPEKVHPILRCLARVEQIISFQYRSAPTLC